MDWITGCMTILAMELLARKRWEGWAVGMLNQSLWLYLIVSRELWGLLPLTVILTWRYSVALIRWRKDHG